MFTQLLNFQGDLEAIQSLLKKRFLPEHSLLVEFSLKLEKIDQSIKQALQSPDSSCKKFLEEQRELAHDLAGRCHQLEVRRDIITLAEDAEALANSSPDKSQTELAEESNQLRNRIELFLQVHRPSKNNSKFLRFARACIAKAEKKEPVLIRSKDGKLKKVISIDSFKSKEVTLEMFDLAESLYGLAALLYYEKNDEFERTLRNSFSEGTQKEIHFHISMTGGSLKNLKTKTDRMRVIQGIIGYAHELTDYYMSDSPYPTIVEIHRLYKDLEFLNHVEEESRCVSGSLVVPLRSS